MFTRTSLQVTDKAVADGALVMDELKAEIRRIVPTLSEERYKGQSGKVAVLGGCAEFTGPSYFASFAALRVGADLAHVFCSKGASSVIKAHSPDIMVHPYLLEASDLQAAGQDAPEARSRLVAQAASDVESWFTRLDCLVIGAGLGRDPLMLDIAREVLQRARGSKLPLVLDGDALMLVAREPELVQGYTQCVLTPNLNEFRRLSFTLGVPFHGQNNDRSSKLMQVARILHGPTIVSKGPVDALCDGKNTILCTATAGAKRCGHQGDILAGAIATFIAWTRTFLEDAKKTQEMVLPELNPLMLATLGGCMVTRTASMYAYMARKRSMVAGDMVEHLGNAMELLFDHQAAGPNPVLGGPMGNGGDM